MNFKDAIEFLEIHFFLGWKFETKKIYHPFTEKVWIIDVPKLGLKLKHLKYVSKKGFYERINSDVKVFKDGKELTTFLDTNAIIVYEKQ